MADGSMDPGVLSLGNGAKSALSMVSDHAAGVGINALQAHQSNLHTLALRMAQNGENFDVRAHKQAQSLDAFVAEKQIVTSTEVADNVVNGANVHSSVVNGLITAEILAAVRNKAQ